jgi:N-acetylglucosaminyl-diphospho-decaprenol L-rhamnosyltransferase
MDADVSTIVVSYNSAELLQRCLGAVAGLGREVIVVENGSANGSAELLRREFPNVELIEPGRNDGFGTGANIGIASASGRWVLLLNPDAWPQPGALEKLVEFAEREPRLGAVGPLLVDPEGRAQRSAIAPPLGAARLAAWAALPGAVSGAYGALRRGSGRVRHGGVLEHEFLVAAALLLRREAFEEIGGFDDDFFMYGEDADLCFRLREADWRVAYCPGAQFVHVGGGTTSSDAVGMYRELLRSWLRLIAKHKGVRAAERARRTLVPALRFRALTGGGESHRAAASWLASGAASDLLAQR